MRVGAKHIPLDILDPYAARNKQFGSYEREFCLAKRCRARVFDNWMIQWLGLEISSYRMERTSKFYMGSFLLTSVFHFERTQNWDFWVGHHLLCSDEEQPSPPAIPHHWLQSCFHYSLWTFYTQYSIKVFVSECNSTKLVKHYLKVEDLITTWFGDWQRATVHNHTGLCDGSLTALLHTNQRK